MKYTKKIEVTELNHSDLVDIFSTALYGNNNLDVDYDAEKYADIIKDCECYEDKIAEILLHGGEVKVIDCLSEEEEQYIPFGKPNINWRRTEWEELECSDYFKDEQGKWGHICYIIDLNTFLMGINSNTQAGELITQIEDWDAIDADRFIQLTIFGEEVYG